MMNRIFFLCALGICTIALPNKATAKDAAYIEASRYANDLMLKTYQSKGLCRSQKECNSRDLLFFNGESYGGDVFLYEVSDQSMISDAASIYAKLLSSTAMKKISVTFYNASHEEVLKRRRAGNPIPNVKLTLERFN